MSEEKRAIVNLTPDHYDLIKAAADRVGLSVPAYCRVVALERAREARKAALDEMTRIGEDLDAE